MEHSDDDFLTARWTGRGSGPWRPAASWRGRLAIGVVAFGLMMPVAAAMRNDAKLTAPTPPLAGSATAFVPSLTATTVPPITLPSATVPPPALASTTVPPPALASTTVPPTTVPPTTVPPTTVPVCAIRFEVRRGDSWYGLADASGVSVRALLAANQAQLTTVLLPGATICLPSGARRPAPRPTTTTTTVPRTTTTTAPRTTTTTAPRTTTTVALPPRASTDEVLRLIREIFPADQHDEAIRIAHRESRFHSDVRNFCCWGVFQIYFDVHRRWLADYGVTQAVQLLDAETNVRMAYVLYQRSNGWGPWRL